MPDTLPPGASSAADFGFTEALNLEYDSWAFGAWRSPVARTVWVREAPGSNPGAPTGTVMSKRGYGVTVALHPSKVSVRVRIPLPALFCQAFALRCNSNGSIAQWSEQSAHNRLVPGSSPGGPTVSEAALAGSFPPCRLARGPCATAPHNNLSRGRPQRERQSNCPKCRVRAQVARALLLGRQAGLEACYRPAF